MGPIGKESTKKRAPAPAASPRKKANRNIMNVQSKKSVSNIPTLTCYAFASEFPIEAYLFCKDENNDGFTNNFKKVLNGTLLYTPVTDARFADCKQRRKPGTDNELLVDKNNFWRSVLFRYLPKNEDSTVDTRMEGLAVLKDFFMSKTGSDYPPQDIQLIDNTNEDDPHSLDMFFMDKDIIDIVKNEFEDSELNEKFFSTYPRLAKKMWNGPHYPPFAHELGFPSLKNKDPILF